MTTTKMRLLKIIKEELDAATATVNVAGHDRLYGKNIDDITTDLGKIAVLAQSQEFKDELKAIRSTPAATETPGTISQMLTVTANLRARLRANEEKFQHNEKIKTTQKG